jgi:cell division protein FtsQ
LRSKNKKRKSAYRRGEKIALFFKRGTVFFLVVVIAALAFLGVKLLSREFHVRDVLVSGNYHLDQQDVIAAAGIKKGDSLFDVPLKLIEERLKENAWIKTASLRKQYPGTFVIRVDEAVPKALLSVNKKLYLLAEDGNILERISGDVTPFLPVIKDIRPTNKKGISESIRLVDSLSKKNILADRESIEIGLESYGLTMNVDGEFIKVGYGNYTEKLERWIALEPEIRKKGVPIKYVDLRFKDSVIVKPQKPGSRRSHS